MKKHEVLEIKKYNQELKINIKQVKFDFNGKSIINKRKKLFQCNIK